MSFQTFMHFFQKEDILKSIDSQAVSVPIDFGIVFLFIQWMSMGTETCLVSNILQNVLFHVPQKKKKCFKAE